MGHFYVGAGSWGQWWLQAACLTLCSVFGVTLRALNWEGSGFFKQIFLNRLGLFMLLSLIYFSLITARCKACCSWLFECYLVMTLPAQGDSPRACDGNCWISGMESCPEPVESWCCWVDTVSHSFSASLTLWFIVWRLWCALWPQ